MQTSERGYDLISGNEGCVLQSYRDVKGVWTIGWGHTPAHPGQVITQEEADHLRELDVGWAEGLVNRLVTVPLNQNQFDALVSFEFNTGGLAGSTLLRKLNAADIAGASNEFPRWNHADGVVIPGLTRRRAQEQSLFLEPC